MSRSTNRFPPLAARFGPIALMLVAAVVLWVKPMGLLLWARIRILTNIPRTAIAEPEADLASDLRIELPPRVAVEPPTAPRRDPFRIADATDDDASPR